MDTELTVNTEPVRRIEVFTGAGRRRRWSAEDKARIVAESVTCGELVCAVARRYGLSPQQLFGWRREARTVAPETEVAFAPVVVRPPLEPLQVRQRPSRSQPSGGLVELEISGVVVRVGRGATAETVAAVVRALKAEL